MLLEFTADKGLPLRPPSEATSPRERGGKMRASAFNQHLLEGMLQS